MEDGEEYVRNRIGKIGSATFRFQSRKISHPMNATHDRTGITSVQSIAALDQVYRVPASSSAKTRRMDAASIRTTPIISSLRNEATVKRLPNRVRILVDELETSEWRRNMMSAEAAAPAGALKWR